ncbi:Mak10 subunit, NatC N-terminal acetyltransferase-domain-containing protein [Infundibulicybe gibba]|nr:Mak10 subunit, NatC N-terminal acetyltransferase-domain-containing protein [Infundibulicybe gibba]
MDVDLGLPGDKFDFEDVTGIFTAAASAMGEDEVILMDNFTLQDAMSAFEIGEPRLDTGIRLDGEQAPRGAFDPLTPLLPQELCWIIDRACAYEMEWHAGNPLSHTVYTLQYVHHLPRLEPEFVPAGAAACGGPERPRELVTVVLRAAVLGLLKCCDLSWRELSKGGVQDGEDWQGDKCEVSLLEGVQVQHVLSKLADAMDWLLTSTNFPVHWLEALYTRLALRKTLLELMDSDIYKNLAQFQHLVRLARVQLPVRASPVLLPSDSPAHMSFDPKDMGRVGGHAGRVGGAELALHDTKCADMGAGSEPAAVAAHLLPRTPYIRSATQSFFYDGILVLHRFSFAWLVDRFFFETAGSGRGAPPLQHIERTLQKGLWYNPPRRRRFLVKSLLEWHVLFHDLSTIVAQLAPLERPGPDVMAYIPACALLWRLTAIREVIFSGFQLELYGVWEKPFAYWYAARVMEAHLTMLDRLLPALSPASRVCMETRFQHDLLTALQALSIAVFAVSLRLAPQPWRHEHTHPSLVRRYKWAFRAEYDADRFFSPRDSVALARVVLMRLPRRAGLLHACDGLARLPGGMAGAEAEDASVGGVLKWDPGMHPWFPYLEMEAKSIV